MTLDQQLQIAFAHQQAGRFAEAESLYREILSHDPRHFSATFLLGTVLLQTNNFAQAADLLLRATRDQPSYVEAHYNLAIAQKSLGKLPEAIISFRLATELNPRHHFAYNNLGIALSETGQLAEAIASYHRAISVNPNYAEAHYNLAAAEHARGHRKEAIDSYRQAIKLKPDLHVAHLNLGNVLAAAGQLDDSIAAYQQTLRLQPDAAIVHYNLGIAYYRKEQFDQAIAAYQRAIELQPHYPEAFNNLANALKCNGQLDAAIAAFRQAITIKPDFAEAHSNLIVTLQYHPDCDAQTLLKELHAWNDRHAQPLADQIQHIDFDPDPHRRLRIGYVSADFCQHVVGRNLLPLLSHHNHQEMEIFCYANMVKSDSFTDRFRFLADHWRDIARLSDAQSADLIRQDRIDILVDLSLHTLGNRLGIFARKPAPVQVTFAGYPGTTGVATIDYRLTDPYLDPPGNSDPLYCESSYRLLCTFWCYQPGVDELSVGPLPAESRNAVTFGCLNNFCKINDLVLNLWARVLQATPSSRLIMLVPQGSPRQRILEHLDRQGISPQRVAFVGRQSRENYLLAYHHIDIGLDTFPYNGHSTSMDSYWMGVPVITLAGQRAVGRAGVSQLNNLQKTEFIAQSPEEFVRIAVDLANDLPRLVGLRRTLRTRMQSSPLMDAPRFARDIELAYRAMWMNRG